MSDNRYENSSSRRYLCALRWWLEHEKVPVLVAHMIQSLGCPFKGVGRKCTEPLVYGWAEIYQVPLYTVGPRYIKCPFLRFGPDNINHPFLCFGPDI